MKNIMFVAPPAAGKGTQASIIAEKYKLPHISTGDILRDVAKEDSEIGNYVKETMKNGGLVKDEITYKLIKDRLARDDCKNGYIIDGFPRNLDQAKEYTKILDELGYEVGLVIYLDIKEEVLEKRITGRRICESCNTIYNINDPKSCPKVESVCDKCGGKLYQRDDDNLESFQTRFNTYVEKTQPIIDYYKNMNVLYEINGDATVEEVADEVDNIINNN